MKYFMPPINPIFKVYNPNNFIYPSDDGNNGTIFYTLSTREIMRLDEPNLDKNDARFELPIDKKQLEYYPTLLPQYFKLRNGALFPHANKTLKRIILSSERLDFITECIKSIKHRHKTIIVFCEIRDHVLFISRNLRRNQFSTAILMGGREDDIRNVDVVITTYGYSGVGVDFPDITALVMASPRKTNTNQLLGRILRDTHQDVSRDIIDIVDPYDIFINQAKKRYEFYKKRNYNIFNYRV